MRVMQRDQLAIPMRAWMKLRNRLGHGVVFVAIQLYLQPSVLGLVMSVTFFHYTGKLMLHLLEKYPLNPQVSLLA
jgi:hypothetical protein